jgi:hypothetical protein
MLSFIDFINLYNLLNIYIVRHDNIIMPDYLRADGKHKILYFVEGSFVQDAFVKELNEDEIFRGKVYKWMQRKFKNFKSLV